MIFICQIEYFRQCIFDALEDESIDVIWVKSAFSDSVRLALISLLDRPPTTVVMFRPEWLSWFPSETQQALDHGVRFVGFSSEPLPADGDSEPHKDQIARYESLQAASDVGLSALIHYDEVSKNLVKSAFSCPVDFHPLPISKKLFTNTPSEDKVFDAIFLGRSTRHREDMLDGLKCRTNIIHVAHGLLDEQASEFYRKSKFSINVHVESYANTEVRVFQSLLSGTPVISEPLTYKYLENVKGVVLRESSEAILETVIGCDIEVDMEEVYELWRSKFDINLMINKINDL